MSEKQAQWGYHEDGRAQIFYGDLPKGWHSAPVKPEHHPNHPDYGKEPEPKIGNIGDKLTIRTPAQFTVRQEELPKRRGRPPKEVKHGDDA